MNILLITSSYPRIYPYFEKAIEDAFNNLGNRVITIKPKYTAATMEMVKSFQPDIILTMVGYKMDPKLMAFLKKTKAIRCIWLTEDPFYMDMSIPIVENYDCIFTIDLGAYEFYQKQFPSKKIYHLPLGTDPSLYYPIEPKEDYLYDLCLIGYPYPERIKLINRLLNDAQHNLILVGPLWKKHIESHIQNRGLSIINKWIKPELARILFNRSKIILNPHRTYHYNKNKNTIEIENKSINNRSFDIAACGGFQLLTNMADIERHFATNQDIVVYSNVEECIELVHQFINDETSRDYYRRNAQKKVLENHTFTHRVKFILNQFG
ncbi:CgeB family protein [Neobacillus muris]|uniref:CgeB family protein n=1 Tax=Neobacillus muris TaxID=2941334 RepID=UPI00203B0415|nr:glycosyltransferase [Neobacillus muris]